MEKAMKQRKGAPIEYVFLLVGLLLVITLLYYLTRGILSQNSSGIQLTQSTLSQNINTKYFSVKLYNNGLCSDGISSKLTVISKPLDGLAVGSNCVFSNTTTWDSASQQWVYTIIPDPSLFNIRQGYAVAVSSNCSFKFYGNEFDLKNTAIVKGINFIGAPSKRINLKQVKGNCNVDDITKFNVLLWDTQNCRLSAPQSANIFLEPGNAYFINSTDSGCTLN